MPECPTCGHENPSGAARCGRCDTPLPAPAPPSTEQIEDQLCALLRAGRKIEAIKIYREANGVGLKEAKDAVEALAVRRGIADPGGCAGRAAALVMLLAVGALGTYVLCCRG